MLRTSLLSIRWMLFAAVITVTACKKDEVKTDPCVNKQFTINAQTAKNDPCATDKIGSITITASAPGSTGFTYSLNGGTFQADNVFKNLAVGKYTIAVKDNNNCVSTAQEVNIEALTAGPKFSEVKALIAAKCGTGNNNCHSAGSGRPNWSLDCEVVSRKASINTRVVTQGTMPPSGALVQVDKDKITAWITAGGKLTD
jgi:hypothetical protein